MRFKQTSGKKDILAVSFKNAEASVTIKQGAPVFFSPALTLSGFDAVSAETLAAALQGFFGGISYNDAAVGVVGDAQVFGMMEYARVLITTRAASSDTWASYAAGAIGDVLDFVTTADVQALSRRGAGSAQSVFPGLLQLGTSYASFTTLASSLGYGVGNSTASVVLARVFLRSM